MRGEREPRSPTDQEDRRDEVREVDRRLRQREERRHSTAGFDGSALNISSMRSVTRKPPTTLIVAEDDRDEREHLREIGVCRAATSIAPTRTMPWIAFVPDMSGVCSIVGTFEMISIADEHGQDEDVMLSEVMVIALAAVLPRAPPRRRRAVRFGERHDTVSPSCVTHVSRVISSSKSSASCAVREEVVQERPDVARVHLARVQRHRAREVELADDGDAVLARRSRPAR